MQVFVADLATCELADDESHHLSRVRRVRDGEPVVAADGAGTTVACVARRDGSEVRLEPVGEPVRHPRPEPTVAVGFSVLKGDRSELVVQKLTECGVDIVAPFFCERTVVQWDEDKQRRQHERMVRVAREAAMQCGRPWLPEVALAADLDAVAAQLLDRVGPVAVASADGEAMAAEWRGVVVGPEGGFSDADLSRLAKRGVRSRVRLGDYVLRAETAGVAAGLALTAVRGGWLAPVPRERPI